MTQETRLARVFALNAAMMVGLVTVGLLAHSLAVVAAGGDYLADAAAIGMSIFAVRLSRHPHGHPRATSIAALINTLLLLAVLITVIVGAVNRLVHGTPVIAGSPVLVVSLVAALVMVFSARILQEDKDRDDLHMRSVMLDTVADAASATGVALTGGIILLAHGLYWLDSAVALLIAAIISFSALRLLHQTIAALRSRNPL